MTTLIFSLVGVFFLVAFFGIAMAIYCYAHLFPRFSKLVGNSLLVISLIFAALLISSNRGGLYGILDNIFLGGGAILLGVLGAAFRLGTRTTVKQA
ncbi:hypothetical protein [Polaromonas aquatica]|uniref:hypothetical protein n=1 Tax=Polaromonas aquatica TaxID=332657 RepID=UPI003D64B7DD